MDIAPPTPAKMHATLALETRGTIVPRRQPPLKEVSVSDASSPKVGQDHSSDCAETTVIAQDLHNDVNSCSGAVKDIQNSQPPPNPARLHHSLQKRVSKDSNMVYQSMVGD